MQIPLKIFGAWKKIYNRVTLGEVAALVTINKVSVSRIMNSGICGAESFNQLEKAFITLAEQLRHDDKKRLQQLEVE